MLSNVACIYKSGSIVKHLVKDTLFDNLFKLGIFLLSNLRCVFDTRAELKIELK